MNEIKDLSPSALSRYDNEIMVAQHKSPPSYSTEFDISTPPPAYNAPVAYKIGSSTLSSPLVDVHQLKAHLSLLRAFRALRIAIEAGEGVHLPELVIPLDGAHRWAWFVGLAVDRFQAWVSTVQVTTLNDWIRNELPPLDVLMVWHAYMLNPGWYAEDCERLPVMRSLHRLNDRFVYAIIEMGDISQYRPSTERQKSWFTQTGTPFDPFEAAAQMTYRHVQCPSCESKFLVEYLNETASGYAQSKFSAVCEGCKFEITKQNLGLAKFVADLVKDPADPQDKSQYGFGVYLAGTLHTQTDATDTGRAERIKDTALKAVSFKNSSPQISRRIWEQELKSKMEYSLLNAYATASIVFQAGGGRTVKRIMGAYVDDRPFSIDLVGAVVRQGSFVDKMHNFGWTEPGYFDDKSDELVLVHSIARYHAFLDLMSSSPTSFFVPTLDIDLAWHSHQLMGGQYAADCMKYIKRFIDHDDNVEENYLATAFDVTCRAWRQRFRVPYMHCGCPLPGNTIGQRLSKLSQIITSNTPATSTALLPAHRSDALSATHSNDHNAVLVSAVENRAGAAEGQCLERIEKVAKPSQRDEKTLQKGAIDEATDRRGNGHDRAFLVPVPFYYSPAGGDYDTASAGRVRSPPSIYCALHV
ncbi:hypothetical protein A0H81_06465 [Grifola frondosa]|uniref:Uncharacterized protein n=1 Tax=Grifola frondosa TaxID=5627 RepID=A0A1C7MB36_GRIFR|nr:hypothetical protein A0H81_06465 [Grifola frondosa]